MPGLNRSCRACWRGRERPWGRWQLGVGLKYLCRELSKNKARVGSEIRLRVNHGRRDGGESIIFNEKSMWLMVVEETAWIVSSGVGWCHTKHKESRGATSVICISKKAPLMLPGLACLCTPEKVGSLDSQLVTISFHVGGRICRLELRTWWKHWCEMTKAGEPKGVSAETRERLCYTK